MDRIGITGIGIVSVHGRGKEKLYNNLKKSIKPELTWNDSLGLATIVAEQEANAVSFMIYAIKEALEDAGINAINIPLIYGWSKETAVNFLKYNEFINRGPEAFGAANLLTNSVGYFYLTTALLSISQNPEIMMLVVVYIFCLMIPMAYLLGKVF